jgi:hypothetical protein
MAPSHIPLWRCFSGTVPPKPPRNILHFLSQLKFDGEGETTASEHAFKFWKFCSFQNITNGNVICRLFTLTFAGPGSRVGVRLCRLPLFTHGNNLCMNFGMLLRIMIMITYVQEISDLRKNEDESLEYFVIIFTHLCYRFPLDDRPSTNDLISCLVSLTNETYELVDEESKSCINVSLHVDLDLNENVENSNGLVGLHMSGSFFTMGDIDQRENYFSEEIYVSSHHSIPPFFLVMKKRPLVL